MADRAAWDELPGPLVEVIDSHFCEKLDASYFERIGNITEYQKRDHDRCCRGDDPPTASL